MESGFAAFDEDEHARAISANTQGWEAEMLAAQRLLERKMTGPPDADEAQLIFAALSDATRRRCSRY